MVPRWRADCRPLRASALRTSRILLRCLPTLPAVPCLPHAAFRPTYVCKRSHACSSRNTGGPERRGRAPGTPRTKKQPPRHDTGRVARRRAEPRAPFAAARGVLVHLLDCALLYPASVLTASSLAPPSCDLCAPDRARTTNFPNSPRRAALCAPLASRAPRPQSRSVATASASRVGGEEGAWDFKAMFGAMGAVGVVGLAATAVSESYGNDDALEPPAHPWSHLGAMSSLDAAGTLPRARARSPRASIASLTRHRGFPPFSLSLSPPAPAPAPLGPPRLAFQASAVATRSTSRSAPRATP